MHPYNSGIVAQDEGLSCGVREALADPIVQALLAADHLDPGEVADLLRRMAAWLSHREAVAVQAPRPVFSNEHEFVWPE
ncbi:MAG TPA: hypothetical protein VHW90_08545 [Stellaceae bacterium]|jgi:hypothetical protein|nr:hypothetical protein [Stellaceae bacterium]